MVALPFLLFFIQSSMKVKLEIEKQEKEYLSFRVVEDAHQSAELSDVIMKDHFTIWKLIADDLMRNKQVFLASNKEEHPQRNILYFCIRMEKGSEVTARTALFMSLKKIIADISTVREKVEDALGLPRIL